jgi:RimJ/RimL family protein N-acetyltransferase
MASEYFLTTARLGFRWWTPGDAPLAQQLWGDPAVTHYIGGPHSAEQVAERLQLQFDYRARCGGQYWPLFLRDGATGPAPQVADRRTDEPAVFVGVCGLRPAPEDRYPAGSGILETGFHLRPPFWRQGYGEEAARAVITYAFEHFHVPALYACRHPENAASGRLILKLGFMPDGEQYRTEDGRVVPNAFLLRVAAWRAAGRPPMLHSAGER